jgi:ribosome-associated heat shock protein Hsp15
MESKEKDRPRQVRPEKVRIDKWLWAARFYKTRSIASEAVKGGKVYLDGARTKPSKDIQIGAQLKIRQGEITREVVVCALSQKRGPASVAQQLYRETEQSIKNREAHKEVFRQQAIVRPHGLGRPTKRDRRGIIRFTRKNNNG